MAPLSILASCGTVDVAPVLPNASFRFGCSAIADSTLLLRNFSTGGSSYHWTLGDGRTSNDASPTVVYTRPGIYKVELEVRAGDGAVDRSSRVITVWPPMSESRDLPVVTVRQQLVYWTWAAVCQMVLQYVHRDVDQCEILAEVHAEPCCIYDAGCWSPETDFLIEKTIRFYAGLVGEWRSGPLGLDEIRSEISQNRPVVATFRKPGYTYTILIVGYDVGGWLTLIDPGVGLSWARYDELLYGDANGYSWAQTYYCLQPQ